MPDCVAALEETWPWPQTLDHIRLASARFFPEQLDHEAFIRHSVPEPAKLSDAAAKRRCEYLAGRLCARTALLALNGPNCCPESGTDRAPCWPEGFVGAITHSDGWAAALVARADHWSGVGLDAETLMSDSRARRLARGILVEEEMARIDDEAPALDITLAFSLKESLFKALYPQVGKRFYFADAELLEWSPDGKARLRLRRDLSERWRAGAEFDGLYVLQEQRLLTLIGTPAETELSGQMQP